MYFTVLIVAAIVVLILYIFSDRIYRFYLFYRSINKIQGPEFAIPFYGFGLKLMSLRKEEQLEWMRSLSNQYKDGLMRVWLGFGAAIHMHKPQHIEIMLRSHTEITKSEGYTYMIPWLGRGLITANGDQWFHHRKLLTPAFHFSILEDFAEVMIEKAVIMNSCIDRQIKIHGDKPFDVFNISVRCALDIICETAMGTNVHAQEGIESEYINAVRTITTVAMKRVLWPWLQSDWIFYNTDHGKSYKAAVITAHDLCTRIIKTKLKERQSSERNNEITGKGKKKAFLDLLLEANEKEEESPLTIREIRDETNTIMFAGHDTTGSLISWTLFSIGNDPEIQRKVHEELDEILGDSDDHATVKKMPSLKYLGRVIKEVLRLYPTVTAIGRSLQNDLQIREHTVPAGATFVIQIYHLHRDPSVWPDPLRFDPDRFLPESSNGRHPYAYIPFSAGPRNCIGQKYAMLEAKLVLAQILRKFSVKSIESHSTIKIYSDIILKPVDGIFITMAKRSTAVK